MNYNPFLNNYNSNYNSNYNPGYQSQGQTVDERIWVTNQQAAESYLVAANSFVRLWDSSQQRYYEKSADCTGRPLPMRIFEYKEVSATPQLQSADYVTTEEFTQFREKVNNFISTFEEEENNDK